MPTLTPGLTALAAAAPLFLATLAQAADPPVDLREATRLMHDGKRESDAGHFDAARQLYAQACTLAPTPRCLRSLANNELRSGHPLDALEHYRQELAHPHVLADVPTDNLSIDRRQMSEAYAKTGHLEIHAPESATITLDGHNLPETHPPGRTVDVEPGAHVLDIRLGEQTGHAETTAVAGADVPVDVRLAPPPASAPPPPSPVPQSVAPSGPGTGLPADLDHASFWNTRRKVGAGVGVAGAVALGVSAYFAAQTKSQQAAVAALPSHGACTNAATAPACSSLQGDLNAQNADRSWSGALLGVGAAAVVGGALLFFWPTSPATTHASHPALLPFFASQGGGLLLRQEL